MVILKITMGKFNYEKDFNNIMERPDLYFRVILVRKWNKRIFRSFVEKR